jgi:hypothetical protein
MQHTEQRLEMNPAGIWSRRSMGWSSFEQACLGGCKSHGRDVSNKLRGAPTRLRTQRQRQRRRRQCRRQRRQQRQGRQRPWKGLSGMPRLEAGNAVQRRASGETTYLQVMQPVCTLGLKARTRFGLSPFLGMAGDVEQVRPWAPEAPNERANDGAGGGQTPERS